MKSKSAKHLCCGVAVAILLLQSVKAETVFSLNFNEHDGDICDATGNPRVSIDNDVIMGRESDNPFKSPDNRSLELKASGENLGGIMFSQPQTIGTNTGAFTMEGWIKPFVSSNMTLFQLWVSENRFYAIIGVSETPDRQSVEPTFLILSDLDNSGAMREIKFRAEPEALDQWTHIALSYGEGRLVFYVNGQPVYDENVDLAIPDRFDQAHMGGGGLGDITGRVDDLRWSDEKMDPKSLGFSKPLDVK